MARIILPEQERRTLYQNAIRITGGFCRICLNYPSAENSLVVEHKNGNSQDCTLGNLLVMCQACRHQYTGKTAKKKARTKVHQLDMSQNI